MLTVQQMNEAILKLRAKGYTINGIYEVTGLPITKICEVIYEQNQKDIANDGAHSFHGTGRG